jgi:type III pantothenate kinase
MILLVDVGNTRIKWVGSDEGGLGKVGTAIHARRIEDLLDELWSQEPVPMQVWVASVAGPALDTQLAAWLQRRWNLTPRYLIPEAAQCGVRNGYLYPERLGADRWAGVIAARQAVPDRAVCVVDCGSAITIDALDSNGLYRGGVILPGIAMMRRSLSRDTGLLPSVTRDELSVFGRDTETGIAAGTLLGAAGMIEHLFARMARELSGLELILTGGDASLVGAHLSSSFTLEPDLVLFGLHKVAEDGSR